MSQDLCSVAQGVGAGRLLVMPGPAISPTAPQAAKAKRYGNLEASM